MTNHLLVFGPGYTASPIMQLALGAGWHVSASYRREERKKELEEQRFSAFSLQGQPQEFEQPVTHILHSIAPPVGGDIVLKNWDSWLRQQKGLHSFHYLSSTNVYGDHGGAWVDEDTVPKPSLARGIRRLEVEKACHKLVVGLSAKCFVYRLAGIYGPGRNALNSLKIGKARRVIKPGQLFGRIHRDDIATTVWAAMNSDHKGGVFNLADDMPTPPQDVITHAAGILGIEPPKEERLKDADMSEMARSFYAESKRVRNFKIKAELGITLKYPNYKVGLAELIKGFSLDD